MVRALRAVDWVAELPAHGVAAIWSPRSKYFHAGEFCIDTGLVGTLTYVIAKGKQECKKCWSPEGYLA